MRDKFVSRSILLRSQQQVETLLHLIPNLPIDPERPLEVLVREQVRQRGLDANGYYWMRIGEIAEGGWFQGRRYSQDVWHEYAKKHILPEEIITKDGEIRSKWVESPDGSRVVISTTQLSKGTFAAFTEEVEAFGASLGVHFRAREYG